MKIKHIKQFVEHYALFFCRPPANFLLRQSASFDHDNVRPKYWILEGMILLGDTQCR